MSPTQEKARQEIAELVAKYQALGHRRLKQYTEADTCKDFLLPLFAALGWDVYNANEVSAEEKVSRGRVDYAFHLRGIPSSSSKLKPCGLT